MTIPISNIIQSATRQKEDGLHILWFPYDGLFDHLLFLLFPQHVFYRVKDMHVLPLDEMMFGRTDNCYDLQHYNQFSQTYTFDCIICNDVISQFDKAKALSSVLHIPIFVIQHQLPMDIMKPEDICLTNEQKVADEHIYTTNETKEAWNNSLLSHTIEYYIPSHYVKEKTNDFVIAGKFTDKDCIKLDKIFSKVKHKIVKLGDNANFSESCSMATLIDALTDSKYFINLVNINSPPLMMWLAMGCGCIPITNVSMFTADAIDKNMAIEFKTEQELIAKLNNTITTNKTHVDIQYYIQEKFPRQKYLNKFTDLFNSIYDHVYVR